MSNDDLTHLVERLRCRMMIAYVAGRLALSSKPDPACQEAADALTAQAREIEALKAQLAHQAKSWGREREIDEETIKALRAVLDACRSTCTRIIEQDGGILGGVDFHALRKGIDAAMQSGKAVTP